MLFQAVRNSIELGYCPSENIECQPLSQGELKELFGARERGEEGENLFIHLKKLAFFSPSEWDVQKQYIHNYQFTCIRLILDILNLRNPDFLS